jgi:hypothetical protein
MTMKHARRRYRQTFSTIVEEQVLGTDTVKKVRRWDDPRPSLREWARKELKKERPHTGKLKTIVR